MAALQTLVPVFFMLGLGYLSRVKKWISPEQKAGANTIVFTVLFPIMIFSLFGVCPVAPGNSRDNSLCDSSLLFSHDTR